MKRQTVIKSFFDTNVLLYTLSSDRQKADVAERLLASQGCISVQVLNEFVFVARRKLKLSWPEIRKSLWVIQSNCEPPQDVALKTHHAALALAERYGYTIYDSLLLASALEQGCDTFYSEDLHDSQSIEGLTIRNPFRKPQ